MSAPWGSFVAGLRTRTARKAPPRYPPARDVRPGCRRMNAKLPSLERLGIRILAWICAALAVLFAVELAVDLSRTSTPWSSLHASARAGQALASTVSRAFNNMTAMVLTFIALAVPLTANMHTPKLIEIFVRDKVNIAAMVF